MQIFPFAKLSKVSLMFMFITSIMYDYLKVLNSKYNQGMKLTFLKWH